MTKNESAQIDELKKEIEALKNDLSKLTQTLGRIGEEKIKSSAEDIKEQILSQIPKEQLEQLKEAGAKSEEILEAIKDQQQKHPAGTLLVAAGIGFLLGRVLGGKS
ncbi:hypothetical protein NNO_1926 [Hydrogenimonas sp.]|nr:hypothetical protein NNO_1926 [Hydrogenimonas sp.]